MIHVSQFTASFGVSHYQYLFTHRMKPLYTIYAEAFSHHTIYARLSTSSHLSSYSLYCFRLHAASLHALVASSGQLSADLEGDVRMTLGAEKGIDLLDLLFSELKLVTLHKGE